MNFLRIFYNLCLQRKTSFQKYLVFLWNGYIYLYSLSSAIYVPLNDSEPTFYIYYIIDYFDIWNLNTFFWESFLGEISFGTKWANCQEATVTLIWHTYLLFEFPLIFFLLESFSTEKQYKFKNNKWKVIKKWTHRKTNRKEKKGKEKKNLVASDLLDSSYRYIYILLSF